MRKTKKERSISRQTLAGTVASAQFKQSARDEYTAVYKAKFLSCQNSSIICYHLSIIMFGAQCVVPNDEMNNE